MFCWGWTRLGAQPGLPQIVRKFEETADVFEGANLPLRSAGVLTVMLVLHPWWWRRRATSHPYASTVAMMWEHHTAPAS